MRLIAGAYQLKVSGQGRARADHALGCVGRRGQEHGVADSRLCRGRNYRRRACRRRPARCSSSAAGKRRAQSSAPTARCTVCATCTTRENGKFRAPLAPGEYDVIVSHGPEFDAVFTTLTVDRRKGASADGRAQANASTRGAGSARTFTATRPPRATTLPASAAACSTCWPSTSSSPPAPSTTASRSTIRTCKHFAADDRMLTCPGMELTGRPLADQSSERVSAGAQAAHAGRRRPDSRRRPRGADRAAGDVGRRH